MDKRITVQTRNELLNLLKQLFNNHEKAALLYDEKGLTRAEGMIGAITEDDNGSIIKLTDGQDISLQSIVAVNGTFMSDYSEC